MIPQMSNETLNPPPFHMKIASILKPGIVVAVLGFTGISLVTSCKKENDTNPVTGTPNNLKSLTWSGSYSDFTSYLNALPVSNRDTALLNFAAREKIAIIAGNEKVTPILKSVAMNSRTTSIEDVTTSSVTDDIRGVGYFPVMDVDHSDTQKWTVLENIIKMWRVESTESFTLNAKTRKFLSVTHNGSQLAGFPFNFSWSQGTVLTHYTDYVALVSVKGSISYGVYTATDQGGLITFNSKNPLTQ